MINTVSLSSDLNTLYLVDDGRVIPFDLTKANGVLLGKIHGQLAVVTGTGNMEELENADGTTPLLIKITENSQHTISYNRKSAVLGLIGATDIVSTITEPGEPPTPTGNCDLNLISLDDFDVHIIRKGDALAFTKLAKTVVVG